VKTAFAVATLFVVGCASPQNASNGGPLGSSPDLSDPGIGGNGDQDMATGNGGGGGGGGGGGVGGGGGGGGGAGGGGGGGAQQDLAMPPDMAMPRDMAMPADMAQTPPACTLNVPISTCGIWPQCGCSGATPNCNVEDTTTFRAACAPAGTTPDWNNCSGNGDSQCGVGRTCVDGVCSPFCGAVADCPGAYRDCFQVVNGSNANITGMKVCSAFCDPTNPQNATGGFTACGPNVNCYPGSDRVPYCVGPTTASGTQDVNCKNGSAGDNTLCAPGYACVTISFLGSTLYQCQKFCHVGGSGECASGYSCSSFGTKQYAGGQEIGGCS
jgi:hypothetical protein